MRNYNDYSLYMNAWMLSTANTKKVVIIISKHSRNIGKTNSGDTEKNKHRTMRRTAQESNEKKTHRTVRHNLCMCQM